VRKAFHVFITRSVFNEHIMGSLCLSGRVLLSRLNVVIEMLTKMCVAKSILFAGFSVTPYIVRILSHNFQNLLDVTYKYSIHDEQRPH
jgi:hypothetical protein